MKPHYIGNVDFAPKNPQLPKLWQLEQPFAQVTSDGYIIICRPWKRTDGASIPRWLWPLLGHPFHEDNAFWSQPHDQVYNDTAVVLSVADIPLDVYSLSSLLVERGEGIYIYDSFAHERLAMPRAWTDWAMREGMGLTGKPVKGLKKAAAWAGVRVGGGKPWNEVRTEKAA